jgi:hypothetical protein
MDVSGQLQAPDTLAMGKKLGVRWLGAWLGSMAVLGGLKEHETSFPYRDTNSGTITSLQVSILILKDYF